MRGYSRCNNHYSWLGEGILQSVDHTISLKKMSESGTSTNNAEQPSSVWPDFGKMASDAQATISQATDALQKNMDDLSVNATGKSLDEHGQMISEQAKALGESTDALTKEWTGLSLDEHGQIIATTASEIGATIATNTSAMAVEVHSSLNKFCEDNTGATMESHGESLVKNIEETTSSFIAQGSEGASALVEGAVNAFVTAGPEAQKQLTQMLEVASPHLEAHGPVIAKALENVPVIKSANALATAIPKSPEYIGDVLATLSKTNVIGNADVTKILDGAKALNLADAKGKLKQEEIIKTYTSISTFFTSSMGKALLSAAANKK